MGYKINYDDLYHLISQFTACKMSLDDTFAQLTVAMNTLGQTSNFNGKAAEGFKSFINEVHLSLVIPTLSQVMMQLEINLSNYFNEYYQIDSGFHTVLQQETLEYVLDSFDGYISGFEAVKTDIEQTISSISDIVHVGTLDATGLEQSVEDITDYVTQIDEDIHAVEDKYYSLFNDTYELLTSIYDMMKTYAEYDMTAISDYQPGACEASSDYQRLTEKVEKNRQNIKYLKIY